MALSVKSWKLWLSLCVFGFLYGATAQKTYSRACQCEKVINGQCAYTLLLPTGGKGDENGVCPSSSSSSSPGEGSTAELEESLEQLAQNISDLNAWTGEQAKTLVVLQNAINSQSQLLGSLQELAMNMSPDQLINRTAEQFEALQKSVESVLEMYQMLSTTVAEQSATVNALAQTAEESLNSMQFSREELIEADNRIAELSRVTGTLEGQIDDLKSNYYLCKSKGLLVSGPIQSIPDERIVGSSIYDETHTPDRVRIFTDSDDQASGAWCPSNTSDPSSGEPNQDVEWIQFDLGTTKVIFGIVTRGRADYAQWVTSFSIQYAEAPFAGADPVFKDYQDVVGDVFIFDGNNDQNTAKTNMLWEPISAQFIRIIPISSFENRNKCMRADLIGCVDAS